MDLIFSIYNFTILLVKFLMQINGLGFSCSNSALASEKKAESKKNKSRQFFFN